MHLPVIIGFGGVNAAGRSSFHHAYRRLVIEALSEASTEKTYQSLAAMMNIGHRGGQLSAAQKRFILEHTLIRRIETSAYDPENVIWNQRVPASTSGEPISFVTRSRRLPQPLPQGWTVADLGGGQVRVDINDNTEFLVPVLRSAAVQSAGQLPSGFNPGSLYASRNHPRALEMTVYAASDALGSLGFDWRAIEQRVAPDQISVYASSAMSQLDENGNGGLMSARFNGKRPTSKQLPLALPEMPADFINAYVLGTMGNTGGNTGACASYLYNLRQAVIDIQAGIARIAVVGGSEAPICPDVIEGYSAMGALATDEHIQALDAGRDTPDWRRASRPFSSNCGFTIAEAAQYTVICSDDLALELGATIYGAVPAVFVNADGHKKSISSPGAGNYITMAKAVATARSILGDESIRQRSYVHAHGTSTPQNRVSESHILNETAKIFGIEQWPVAAIKAYLGHSIAVSSGDQMAACLGTWEEGIIPGIATIDHVADDVHREHLLISSKHLDVGKTAIDSSILNAKGFGGNNASCTVLAPHVTLRLLENKHGKKAMTAYQQRNEPVREQAEAFDVSAMRGESPVVYKFDHNVIHGEALAMTGVGITIPGYNMPIDLSIDSPYAQWR